MTTPITPTNADHATDDAIEDVIEDVSDDVVIGWHDAHHARLQELILQTLEHLAGGDVGAARSLFSTCVTELLRGLALEDDVILPLYDTLGPHAPQGRRVVVDGDHTILRRTIEAVGTFFDDVDGEAPPRRQRAIMVGLPVVYRLLHTLEHHTEREARHVYPVVVPRLQGEPRRLVALELRALAQASAPAPG
jgi:hypothetical protein